MIYSEQLTFLFIDEIHQLLTLTFEAQTINVL